MDDFGIFDYRLVVFDLDGTLYRQRPVRQAMLLELIRAGGAPGRLSRLWILRRYRRLRENFAATAPQKFDAPLFTQLSQETGYATSVLRDLTEEWMERRPLKYLAAARIAGGSELIDALRARGVSVGVWSDYRVADKLAALGIGEVDHRLSASDPELGALKPDPAGLQLLMRRAGVTATETLMIGDRLTHDGAAARAAGVDFVLRADRVPRKLSVGQPYLNDFRSLVPLERQASAA